MDRNAYLAKLHEALNMPFGNSLPERTQQEQRAGRNRIVLDLRRCIVQIGEEDLRRRFGRSIKESMLWHDAGEWKVEIVVYGSQGETMSFVDSLMAFPSDETIAQIALIV